MNKKIIKLENNKEYFSISELEENGIKYLLLINIDNEEDIKIVKKVSNNNEEYIIEIENDDILIDLKNKFKSLVEEDKKNYA
ncbi:MAG: hypothetical protein IJ105_01880 [Bacilli bacterium]|nr:hypothetical protein [Bacilli bacterium]